MASAIRHRGPDDGDTWVDAEAGIAFGHRRLSIIDLSAAGHQPMASSCGRFVLSYNGEVYNAPELRAELEAKGRRFRGHSDTEVIVEGIAEWGLESTVKRLVGMFAFSVWDRENRQLALVRDRVGIKPLYWGQVKGRLVFASELKALHALPDLGLTLDRSAVATFLRHNYIPAPHSIYREVAKLEPGCILTVRAGESPVIEPYWRLDEVVARGRETALDLDDVEATDLLEASLADAVKRRMVADVPLGAFLSGGIDSSTVVALMQAHADRPVRSFSIGFHEPGFDEAGHAKAVAGHLGTDHTELYVSPAHALEIIPNLPKYYDEPFSDSSQIPTFLVSEMTREHVTVALSGDGGDELFGGYNRYFQARNVVGSIGRLPVPLRAAGAAMIRWLPPRLWDRIFGLVPGAWRPPQAGDKMHKLAAVLTQDEDGFYRRLISHWLAPEEIVPGAAEYKGLVWDPSVHDVVPDYIDRMQYLDALTYLPDDILTKVDRASMAVSLEVRVPILDHRVVELAWRLPRRHKIRGSQGKWLLRQVLARHLPPALFERPKMGFGVPIDTWMCGPLRDWCEALLDPVKLGQDGLFDGDAVRGRWQAQLAGRANDQYLLWDILMFQAWRAEYG